MYYELFTEIDLGRDVQIIQQYMKEALPQMLSKFINKDLQMLYSGCGRIQKGKQKKDFSATNLYKVTRGTFDSYVNLIISLLSFYLI